MYFNVMSELINLALSRNFIKKIMEGFLYEKYGCYISGSCSITYVISVEG